MSAPQPGARSSLARLWIRGLVKLLPAAFRARHEQQILEDMRNLGTQASGRLGLSGMLIAFSLDLFKVLPSLWIDSWRQHAHRHVAPLPEVDLSSRRQDSRPRRHPPSKGASSVLELLRQDLALARRSLFRRPGFSLTAIVTLGVGLGATAALFTVADKVIFQPLPFAEPEELVAVWQTDRNTGTTREAASIPDWIDFRDQSQALDDVAGFILSSVNLSRRELEPRQLSALYVTRNFGSVLGVEPTLGRSFSAQETRPGGPAVALVSPQLARQLGPRDELLGSEIQIDSTSALVLGVLPDSMTYPAQADIWLPLQQDETTSPRYTHPLSLVGRLAEGHEVDTAQEELTAIAARLEAEYPENDARGAFVESLESSIHGSTRPALLALLGAVCFVLAIATLNVANLFAVHFRHRRADLAVCSALGSSRARIASRLFAETALVTGGAALMAAPLALLAMPILLALAPSQLAELEGLTIGSSTWILIGVIALLIAVVICAIALAQLRVVDLAASLTHARRGMAGGRLGFRLQQAHVVGQVALTLVLLVGAVLTLSSLGRLRAVDPGFATDQVLRASFRLPSATYPRDFSTYPNWHEINNFNDQLLDHAARIPGVDSAALATNHPLDPGWTNSFNVVGRPARADQGELRTRMVSASYFETFRTQLVSGRFFSDRDRVDAQPVLILNEAAVARYFEDQSPIEQRISFWGIERTVVGVIENERVFGLDQEAPPAMYVPSAQAPTTGAATVMVRSSLEPRALEAALRAIVTRIDPNIPLYDVTTMDATINESIARRRFASLLLGSFAGLALALSLVGIHGLLAYLVSARRREMGIRLAFGAKRSSVVTLVLSRALAMIVPGLALGLLAAAFVSQTLSSLLYEVSPTDIRVYALAALALAVTGVLACAAPAFRASTVDPATTLGAD